MKFLSEEIFVNIQQKLFWKKGPEHEYSLNFAYLAYSENSL